MSLARKLPLAFAALALTATAIPAAAVAQDRPVGILTCDAPGGRQQAGAAIGAVLGGLVGSQVSDNERTLGAVVGAAGGAAAGSYVGCQQQRDRARQAPPAYASQSGYGNATATSTVNVRSGPGTDYGRVGSLQRGQSFEAGERLGDWVGVMQNGQLVGYVSGRYVSY